MTDMRTFYHDKRLHCGGQEMKLMGWLNLLLVSAFAVSTGARAQEITTYSEYKRAVRKSKTCAEELAKLDASVRSLEKNLKKLQNAKAPDKESKEYCRNGCAALIDHYNQRVDDIYAKPVGELTPAEKDVRDFCGAGKSCKLLKPPAGQPEKDLDAKGGTCGIVYAKSATKQGVVRRHYEQVLSVDEQGKVNACWWVQSQIEIAEAEKQLKTGEDENGEQTLVSQRDAKEEECETIREKFEGCDECAVYSFQYAQEKQLKQTWKVTEDELKDQPILVPARKKENSGGTKSSVK